MEALRELFFGEAPIRWLQDLFGPDHPLPFTILSLLGDTWGMMVVIGFGFWLFGRRVLYPLVAIVVVGAATKVALTELFSVPRPQGPGIVVHEHLEIGSFPSGHVYEAVGPWGLLYVMGLVPLRVPVAVAALVGLGRLYLGTHYLADVLAGVLFGAGLVWLFVKLWPPVRRWLAERGWVFYTVLAVVAIAGTLVWMSAVSVHGRRYEIFGMIIAAAVGLPLEHRFLRYAPTGGSRRTRAAQVAAGVLGIAAFLLWSRSGPEDALLLRALTAGLATLWTVLGAPALFVAAGAAGRGISEKPAALPRGNDPG